MKRFIFDARGGIYIIDLAKSLAQLKEAQKFLYEVVARGRKVLFVGTKKQAQDTVREAATKLNQPYVVHRWLGGTLTNSTTVRQSVARMRELEAMQEDGRMDALRKKESARLGREHTKLRRNLSGVADLETLPGALFVIDINREAIAVAEANRLKIPVVAIVDTNTDPEAVDYPIPGNDDAIRAIKLVINLVGETLQEASNEYAKVLAEEARRKAREEAEAAAKAAKAEEERKVREAAEKKAREEAALKAKAEAEAAKAAKAKADAEAKTEAEPPATPDEKPAKKPAAKAKAPAAKAEADAPEAAEAAQPGDQPAEATPTAEEKSEAPA
jgi:small subunit ribosomal protein S2